MYARAVDDAQTRLAELRRDELLDVALGTAAFLGSLLTSVVYPPLAVPLLVGGLVTGACAVATLWRRWDLVDRLADDRDAYRIPEVEAYAAREAHLDRRRYHAELIRSWARQQPEGPTGLRVREAADQLEALARDLENPDLELTPACAVACRRLLTDPTASPIFNQDLRREDVPVRIQQIRAGFSTSRKENR